MGEPEREYFGGIDPGRKGYFVVLSYLGSRMVDSWDVPMPVQEAGEINWQEVNRILSEVSHHVYWTIEDVSTIYIKNAGSNSVMTFGMGYGGLLALLQVNKVSHQLVRPAAWMKEMHAGLSKDESTLKTKERSLIAAKRLFPSMHFSLKQDGKADAALIAEYGRRVKLAQKTTGI